MDERELIQKYVEERDAFRDRIINDDGFGLHYAAETGDIDLAEIKIDIAGTDINYRDDAGFTPLLKAVLREQEEFITFIMDKGADPDIRNREGATALHIAAARGNVKIIKSFWNTERTGLSVIIRT